MAILPFAAFLGAATASHHVTSRFQRAPPARDLREEEIDGCEFTFTTMQKPDKDYFRGAACSAQAHVSLAGPTSALVSFVTPEALASEVVFWPLDAPEDRRTATGAARSYTSIIWVEEALYAPDMGAPFAPLSDAEDVANTSGWAAPDSASYHVPAKPPKDLQDYKNPGAIYSSPVIHAVALDDLTPGATYAYEVAGDGATRTFAFPRSGYPFALGLTADLGQTVVSNRSLSALDALDPDLILVGGDLSYADGWPFRWDTFGRLSSRVFGRVPTLATGGNHEVGSGEQWVHFEARWPTPHASSGSTSPLYWSVDAGPAHVVALNSYDNFLEDGDRLQRAWLAKDLARVDRSRTPWVVVMMHAPFYNSNGAHHDEAELMRRAYEPLLYEHGVDVVLAGHVHAYERSDARGVYDYDVDPCGPVYVNLGDGGNRENTYTRWAAPHLAWSAFRESSFGVGHLELLNATHAHYRWKRDACGKPGDGDGLNLNASSCATPGDAGGSAHEVADEFALVRDRAAACAKRRSPPAIRPPPAVVFPPDAGGAAAPSPRRASRHAAREEADSALTVELSLLAVVLGTIASFALGLLAGYCRKDVLRDGAKRGAVECAALITPPSALYQKPSLRPPSPEASALGDHDHMIAMT